MTNGVTGLPAAPIVMIPARMQARRLPGKPMADIAGEPMIVHVWRRAMESGLGRVVVACAEDEIAAAIKKAGGEAVLTPPNLASGSDRVFAALQTIDLSGKHDAVINVQGDVPTIDPSIITSTFALLANPEVDIGTAVAPITDARDIAAPSVVKAVMMPKDGQKSARVWGFSRGAPGGAGTVYGHIGLYAWRRRALERFVSSPQSVDEAREGLEQLRAMALGLRIDAVIVDDFPLGVDTPEDLEKARNILHA